MHGYNKHTESPTHVPTTCICWFNVVLRARMHGQCNTYTCACHEHLCIQRLCHGHLKLDISLRCESDANSSTCLGRLETDATSDTQCTFAQLGMCEHNTDIESPAHVTSTCKGCVRGQCMCHGHLGVHVMKMFAGNVCVTDMPSLTFVPGDPHVHDLYLIW